MSPLSGVDINTAEHSMDEMAAKNSPWLPIIREAMHEFQHGELPRQVRLSGPWLMLCSQEDDGLYSGYVKNDTINLETMDK